MDQPKWTADAARDRADDLSRELYGLVQLTKLVAFAAESRRVLVAIEDQLTYRPDVREKLMENIEAMLEWSVMSDTSSDALAYISRKMDQTQGEFTELAYQLAAQAGAQDKMQAALDAAAAH